MDRTADVYAIGAMLYHLIVGRSPYAEYPNEDVLGARPCRPARRRRFSKLAPDAPRDLVAIAQKAMARCPEDRHPTAREMAEELRRFATGGLVGAYRYGLWELAQRFFERQRAVVLTVAAALLALTAFGTVSVARIATERDHA